MSTEIERFERRLKKTDGCWIWTGAKANAGYPHARYKGKPMNAQRVAYILYVGPVSPGMDIDHLCRNKMCVNPAHLEQVTHRENCRRRTAHVTKCANGHTYSHTDKRGTKRCRICDRAASKRSRENRTALARATT